MDLARWSWNYWEVGKQRGKRRFLPFFVHLHVMPGWKRLRLSFLVGGDSCWRMWESSVQWGLLLCVSMEIHQLGTSLRKTSKSVQGPIPEALTEHLTKTPHSSRSGIHKNPRQVVLHPCSKGTSGSISLKESKACIWAYRVPLGLLW